jgi:hydroxypyruvate reductase
LAQAAAPAPVLTLLISDIPGDDPAAIASGPTLADDSTPQDALAIIGRYDLPIPAAVMDALRQTEPCTAKGDFHIIASPMQALKAAAKQAAEMGYRPHPWRRD